MNENENENENEFDEGYNVSDDEIILKCVSGNSDYIYFQFTIGERSRFLKVIPEGATTVLLALDLLDTPEGRYTSKPVISDSGAHNFRVTDNLLETTNILSNISYWELMASLNRAGGFVPVNLMEAIEDEDESQGASGTSIETATEIALVTHNGVRGMDSTEVYNRLQGNHVDPDMLKGEYTSSLSKPADSADTLTMAFLRKLSVLSNEDSLEDLGTFKSILAVLVKLEKNNHERAWLLYQTLTTYLDTMVNLTSTKEDVDDNYHKQLKGVESLFFGSDKLTKAPEKEINLDLSYAEEKEEKEDDDAVNKLKEGIGRVVAEISPPKAKSPKVTPNETNGEDSVGMNLLQKALSNHEKDTSSVNHQARTESKVDEIINLYTKEHKYITEICKITGISHQTAIYILKENGIEIAEAKVPVNEREDEQEIIDEYLAGERFQDIATKHSIANSSIYIILKNNNIPKR